MFRKLQSATCNPEPIRPTRRGPEPNRPMYGTIGGGYDLGDFVLEVGFVDRRLQAKPIPLLHCAKNSVCVKNQCILHSCLHFLPDICQNSNF